MRGRLFLIHWNAAEAAARADTLRADGWEVALEAEDGARAGRRITQEPPDAVVIFLTRLPSHGRETADGLRARKATRSIPIVFVGGQGDALAKTRAKVPDATYTTPGELAGILLPFGRANRVDAPSVSEAPP